MDQAHAAQLTATGAASKDKQGRKCLNVPAFFQFTQDLTAGESRIDLSQSVDADADFYWRGWKYVDTGALYTMTVRFGLLNGYYLSNVAYPLQHINLRSITPELRIPAGGFIRIEAANADVATRKLKIVFFGVKRFYLPEDSK